MIVVKKPQVFEKEGKIVVSYPIEENGAIKKCFFSVDKSYRDFMTFERGDAVLVMLLMYAIKHKQNIKLEIPVSSRLYYQLTNYQIDAFEHLSKKKNHLRIYADLISQPYEKNNSEDKIVATGMSLGVDSLCTFYTHNVKQNIIQDFKINLLTFFNIGAFYYGDGKAQKKEFEKHHERVKEFSKEVNIPLLIVDSNFAAIFPMEHDMTDAMRNCGLVLLFQKMIDIYYYSSTCNINAFHLDVDKPSAYYEIYTLHNLSTDNTIFYSSNSSYTRMRKVDEIAKYELAQKYLSVCTRNLYNCGKCHKCARTLVLLEAGDNVSKFEKVFDLDDYKKRKDMLLGYVWASRKEVFLDSFEEDTTVPRLKASGKFTAVSYFYGILFIILKPIEKWMRKLPVRTRRALVNFATKYHLRVPF